MSFISKLRDAFSPGEEPAPEYVAPVLGAMRRSEDDEAWIGEYNGFCFALPYERKRELDSAVVYYAREHWRTHKGTMMALRRPRLLRRRTSGSITSMR